MEEKEKKELEKEKKEFARKRTILASERTFLSFLRTGLAIIVAGLAVIKFFKEPFINLGMLLIVLGTGLILYSIFRLERKHKKREEELPEKVNKET